MSSGSDQGLYFDDVRYISAETLRLDGRPLVSLLADASEGDQAVFELTNPDLRDNTGEVRVRKEALGMHREKRLGDDYSEVITLQNHAEFTLQLAFEVDFEDMFVVRGMHFRLPEVFAGYDRSFASKPVKYPVACTPQAWAAGSIPYMLASTLGLRPDAFNRRLCTDYPHLPPWLECVTVRHLRVGEAEVDLRYERSEDETLVAVTNKHGDATVSVQP